MFRPWFEADDITEADCMNETEILADMYMQATPRIDREAQGA
jgi:hypothetical protein